MVISYTTVGFMDWAVEHSRGIYCVSEWNAMASLC